MERALCEYEWLQELPRPLTKLTWDNPLMISLALARKMELQNGDLAELAVGAQTLRLPVWVMPGQAAGCVTALMGFGRDQVGTVGQGVGYDVQRLMGRDQPATLRKLGGSAVLACTDHHNLVFDRAGEFVRHGPLTEFIADPPRGFEFCARGRLPHAVLRRTRTELDLLPALEPGGVRCRARETNLTIGTVNTVILVTSGLVFSLGLAFVQESRERLLVRCCALALALGMVFLVLKFGLELGEDFHKRLFPGPGFGLTGKNERGAQLFFTFYFVGTALHGVHLLAGLGLVGWIMLRAHRREFSPAYHTPRSKSWDCIGASSIWCG